MIRKSIYYFLFLFYLFRSKSVHAICANTSALFAQDFLFHQVNPTHVITEAADELLPDKILADYIAENPRAKTMLFTAIKWVLVNRYKIDTKSAGLFFRNQLTEGGNRNKMVLIETKSVDWIFLLYFWCSPESVWAYFAFPENLGVIILLRFSYYIKQVF